MRSSSTEHLASNSTNSKKGTLAQLEKCSENDCKPVSEVFTVIDNKAKLTDISHIKNIDLTHVPSNYLDSYRTLLANFADVFSRHDLDVGHCKTLPHRVCLTNPNKIVSINQYRLPYHLKAVSYTHLTLPTIYSV